MNGHYIYFSEKPAFHTNSSWKLLKGDPYFEVLLRRAGEKLITVIERPVRHSSLSQEEWKAIRSLEIIEI